MNMALERFSDDPRVTGISGYTPPVPVPQDYDVDYFLLPRFCAWGFAIWAEDYARLTTPTVADYRYALARVRHFGKMLGLDALPMLNNEVRGNIDALDVKAMWFNWKNSGLTVYPRQSLTRNSGHDGSGIHCLDTDRFETSLWDRLSFDLSPEVDIELAILKANGRFRRLPLNRLARLYVDGLRSR